MDDLRLEAFFQELEELEKTATIGSWIGKNIGQSLWKGVQNTGQLIRHPGKTLAAGWRDMAPNAEAVAKYKLDTGRTGIGGAADWLARKGITGKSRVGRYLPVGQRGLFGGAAALGAPSIAKGVVGKDGENMESALENVGGNIGWVAGSPVPLVGNIAGMSALTAGGKYLGRGVDRLLGRKAPGLGSAAPEQLGSVQRFGE